MGQGMERSLLDIDKRSRLEERIEADFLKRLVNHAAPVICGVKPVSIFNYFPRVNASDLESARVIRLARSAVEAYARLTSAYDVELVIVHESPERLALLAYRPSAVGQLLEDAQCEAYLRGHGYDTTDARSVIASARERMEAYYTSVARKKCARHCISPCDCPDVAFPHEIGVLLGYPIADVVGFIENKGKGAKDCGFWKVYDSPEAAQRMFEEIKRGTLWCKRCIESGMSLGAMLRLKVA